MKKHIKSTKKEERPYFVKSSSQRNIIYYSLLIMHLLFLAPCLYAYSIYDLNLGTEVLHHDSRATAMGSSGVAAGFSLFDSSFNPANLYYLENNTLQMSYSLIKNSENRAIPLWNFFNSYVDESTYARNEHFYNEVAFGINYSYDIEDIKLSAGLMYRPVVNFGANYTEQIRSAGNQHNENYPPIYAKNYIESKGWLDSYNFLINVGMPFLFDNVNLSFGTEISYLMGDYEIEKRIHWTDTARNITTAQLDDFYEKVENKMDGMALKFGVASNFTDRWRVGFAYSPRVTLDANMKIKDGIDSEKIEIANAPDYIIPSRMRMGFLFMPRNPFRTNFQFDFEIINYSELKDKIAGQNSVFYEDGYAFYVGMEHYVGRAVPLRLGFSHRTARQNKSIGLPIISGGTSFPIMQKIQLDIAGEYGKREYTDLDLFPDGYYNASGLWPNNHTPRDRGWENPDSVTESFWKVFSTVSFKF